MIMKILWGTLLGCLQWVALYAQQQPITVANIYQQYAFYERGVYGVNWMNDGQYFSSLADNKIIRNSITDSLDVKVIVDGEALGLKIDDYAFSEDEQRILLMTDKKSIYRRSFSAVYYVYRRDDQSVSQLSSGRQSYATFSPDGKLVAFTRENNLFYKNIATGKEVAITTDGEVNHIINGSTDWVYEEEFYLTKAFFWSPDAKQIAFLRFDESAVREYTLQLWNDGALYPENYTFKYPKAGEKNSEVNAFVYDLAAAKKMEINLGPEKDIYLPRMIWTKQPGMLSLMKVNRLQNKLDLLHVDVNSGVVEEVYTDKSDTYVDLNYLEDPVYLDDGKYFILPSERDGYKHFYRYDMDGKLVNQITSGPWEATELVGLSQAKGTPVLYYLSTEVSPLERHLYRVQVDGKKKEKLTTEAGTYSVVMSDDAKYQIRNFSNATTPRVVSLYKTSNNKRIKLLEENKVLKGRINTFGLQPKEFFTFKTVDGTELNGYFIKPANFDAKKQYPVLVYQYSGPGSQNVLNAWGGSHYYWHQMLVQKGYIIAVVDSRGTGARGVAFKKQTYEQLGKFEVVDLMETARYLGALPYVDKNRIGIWGWSYGGYMSSLAITKGGGLYKAAIAVAPVTNWRFYDTIYTERYMGLPQDNADGYDNNSPCFFADKLEGKYLLVHGTGDDNVHFQNAVTMQERLIKAGKQFSSFYYPDKTHSISGGQTRTHLFTMLTDFVLENL